MRVAVIGKGGAGKSVIAGTMARLVARQGTPVLVLDSDPLPGLSVSLGSGPEPRVPPLAQATEQDTTGQWRWSEGVDATTAAQRFATDAPDGVRVLQRVKFTPAAAAAGTKAGTSAEAVAATASSKAFWEVVHGLVDAPAFSEWTLIGDLPGGPVQVAQGWAPYARTFLLVVQPTCQSALTARRLARLARLHSPETAIAFVANNVRGDRDVRHVEKLIGTSVLAAVPADPGVAAAERAGTAPVDHALDSPVIEAIEELIAELEAGVAIG